MPNRSQKTSTPANLVARRAWGDANFSGFAFDLIALLNGTFRESFVSSLHGFNFRASS
jgi:hypothetical protein